MLKSKEQLAGKLKGICDKVLFEKKIVNEILEGMKENYNIPTGITMDMLTGRTDLINESEFFLFALCKTFDETLDKHNTEKYFTPIEIDGLSKSKWEEEKIKFPIEIKCIPVTADQWIGSVDIDFLMKLRKAQLINYNVNAQRTLQRVVRGERSYYKITLNKDAIRKISSNLENGSYIPNTITLNMPETASYSYDDSRNILSIREIDHFDISDGYHRYIAMSQIKDKNPDFNYPMELRIIMFSEDKVKQFIYQEDQKTKMRKIDSDSMNMNAPENNVIERLNRDVIFNFKNKIGRNDSQINYGEFASVIRFFYFKGQTADKSIKRIIEVEGEIRDKLNELTNRYNDLLEKQYSFSDLMIIFYMFTKEECDYNSVYSMLGKANELDGKTFAVKVPRVGMISEIKKLEEA